MFISNKKGEFFLADIHPEHAHIIEQTKANMLYEGQERQKYDIDSLANGSDSMVEGLFHKPSEQGVP